MPRFRRPAGRSPVRIETVPGGPCATGAWSVGLAPGAGSLIPVAAEEKPPPVLEIEKEKRTLGFNPVTAEARAHRPRRVGPR